MLFKDLRRRGEGKWWTLEQANLNGYFKIRSKLLPKKHLILLFSFTYLHEDGNFSDVSSMGHSGRWDLTPFASLEMQEAWRQVSQQVWFFAV